jgi:nucleotide-binding universal stress UspA family protein
MSAIVCPIRGGVGSKTTVRHAVLLAQATGLPLHFLYVINPDLLLTVGSNDMDALFESVRQMGVTVLEAASAWADSLGIGSQGIVRHGSVKGEIAAVCRDLGADYPVLGRPRGRKTESIFTQPLLGEFVHQIERQTGASVVLSGGVGQ